MQLSVHETMFACTHIRYNPLRSYTGALTLPEMGIQSEREAETQERTSKQAEAGARHNRLLGLAVVEALPELTS